MAFVFFLISLSLLVVLIIIKNFEQKKGDGFLFKLSARFDSFILWSFHRLLMSIDKKSIVLSNYIKHSFPHSVANVYGGIKKILLHYQEHFFEILRDKQDLSKKKSSSLFLRHIDPNNHLDNKK